MAKKSSGASVHVHEPMVKKSSTSGKMSMIKFASMNKDKKRSFKRYRGQGR